MRTTNMAVGIGLLALVGFLLPPFASSAVEDHQRQFGFGDREIYEFTNNMSGLVFKDLNDDGHDDIVFINNQMSRIEVLLRKPSAKEKGPGGLPALEEQFTSIGFLLEQKTFHLEVLDLDGDARQDILTAGTQRGLRIYLQNREGRFGRPLAPSVKATDQIIYVGTADFDADGRMDILVGRRKNAEILYNDGDGRFQRRLSLAFTAADCEAAMIGDFDGDRYVDILLRFPKENLPLRLFRGQPEGVFGWEHPLETPPLRTIAPISLIDQQADQLLAIRKNAINVHHYTLTRNVPGDIWRSASVTPARIVARGASGKYPIAWTTADFNRDGNADYCLSAPELSQIMIHFGTERDLNPMPRAISSLRRIKTLGVDRHGDLYVFSPEEKAIARHPRDHLEAFPAFVNLPGTPLMMDVSRWHPGFFTIIADKQQRLLFCWADQNGEKRSVPIGLTKKQPPDAMRVFPVAPKLWGVVLFSPLKTPVMYLWNGRRLTPVTPQQFRALGIGLTAADIGIVGSPQAPGLIISEGQTARLYRMVGPKFEIQRQFSLPDEKAVLKFGVDARGPGGATGYLLYNKTGHELCWFPADGQQATVCMALTDAYRDLAGILPLNLKSGQSLLLPGRVESRRIRADAESYTLQAISDYTSRAESPKLWHLCPLRLGNPPRAMAAALDAQNATIELLSIRKGDLTEEVSFQVFQGPQFNRNERGWYYEPREVTAGDLNADRRMDLGILVHDKLVIHLGE
ncbi:MAG: VCBS repeat-containing protein [Desulfobacterales bacterium]